MLPKVNHARSFPERQHKKPCLFSEWVQDALTCLVLETPEDGTNVCPESDSTKNSNERAPPIPPTNAERAVAMFVSPAAQVYYRYTLDAPV
jgi:hypothetical protein